MKIVLTLIMALSAGSALAHDYGTRSGNDSGYVLEGINSGNDSGYVLEGINSGNDSGYVLDGISSGNDSGYSVSITALL